MSAQGQTSSVSNVVLYIVRKIQRLVRFLSTFYLFQKVQGHIADGQVRFFRIVINHT
jgi:hypothetical protein